MCRLHEWVTPTDQAAEIAAIAVFEAQRNLIAPATDPTYLQLLELLDQHPRYQNYSPNSPEMRVVRAACEVLHAQHGAPVSLEQLQAFLAQDWELALHELEADPRVLPLIAYTLYLRVYTGSFERGTAGQSIMQTAWGIVRDTSEFIHEQEVDKARKQAAANWQALRSQHRAAQYAQYRRAIRWWWVRSFVEFVGIAAFGAGVAVVAMQIS